MIARSPGLTEGPHKVSCRFKVSPLGESFPSFRVSPVLPMGNWVRIYTRSELKVRISSIRCCSVSGIFLSSAQEVTTPTRHIATSTAVWRGRIQPPLTDYRPSRGGIQQSDGPIETRIILLPETGAV